MGFYSSVEYMCFFKLIELTVILAPSVCFGSPWKMLSTGTVTK